METPRPRRWGRIIERWKKRRQPPKPRQERVFDLKISPKGLLVREDGKPIITGKYYYNVSELLPELLDVTKMPPGKKPSFIVLSLKSKEPSLVVPATRKLFTVKNIAELKAEGVAGFLLFTRNTPVQKLAERRGLREVPIHEYTGALHDMARTFDRISFANFARDPTPRRLIYLENDLIVMWFPFYREEDSLF